MPPDPIRYAHSLPGRPREEWERLDVHLREVADLAAEFAQAFGWAAAARVAGLLHDIGKASAEFQAYISDEGSSPDHSTAGAVEAVKLYGDRLGRLLAFLVAGHHAGLADGTALAERLRDPSRLPDYRGWEAYAAAPPRAALAPTQPPKPGGPPGFGEAFLTRMLFSCLVDADFLRTEAFYGETARGGFAPVETLAARLVAHLEGFSGAEGPVNRLRAEVLAHATAKAQLPPGLFTLTVPTGGGKTLTSLSFALEHARRHGLRRVVYVIPYTSIIEQTAQVFRQALDAEDEPSSILEHHASFDWEAELPRRARAAEADDGQGAEGLAKLRRAAENWDAPVVVTTAVQFFESLFANRTSRCRKLHNLAGAVIVLDEAQTLPLPLLRPCLAALDELQRNYGASIVLCTATQPAIRVQDRKLLGDENKQTGERRAHGLDIPDDRELAPDPRALYEALKRVEVEVRPGETPDAVIVDRFTAEPRMLCIVNSRAHARALYDAIAHLEGAVHLSTLMCPVHRQAVLKDVRAALDTGRPARVVSTSLIEAGVDISFPEVWRASTGLESIAQAAGRCNRNAELNGQGRLGHVVVFTPPDPWRPPRELEQAQQAAASALSRTSEPLGLAAIADYFGELYTRKDFSDLDSTVIELSDVRIKGVLAAFAHFDSPFAAVAERFRLIKETTLPVVVPYDDTARAALDRLAAAPKALAADLRTLQRYTVGIPRDAYDEWLVRRAIYPVREDLGSAIMRFHDRESHYRDKTGVDIANPLARSAEAGIIS